jgi:hypothetical protein
VGKEHGDLSRFAGQEEFRTAFDDQFSEEYRTNKSKLSVKANEVCRWSRRSAAPTRPGPAGCHRPEGVHRAGPVRDGRLGHPLTLVHTEEVRRSAHRVTHRTTDEPPVIARVANLRSGDITRGEAVPGLVTGVMVPLRL